MSLHVRRAYDKPDPSDGYRVLVDRVWPRGVSRSKLQLDLWAKDVAPSTGLRKWFDHDQAKWIEFRQRYFQELTDKGKAAVIESLVAAARRRRVTLVYGATETHFNNASALKGYLERRLAKSQAARKKSRIPTRIGQS
jgi:uncharacterized protein YeaO (DUF488 family)